VELLLWLSLLLSNRGALDLIRLIGLIKSIEEGDSVKVTGVLGRATQTNAFLRFI